MEYVIQTFVPASFLYANKKFHKISIKTIRLYYNRRTILHLIDCDTYVFERYNHEIMNKDEIMKSLNAYACGCCQCGGTCFHDCVFHTFHDRLYRGCSFYAMYQYNNTLKMIYSSAHDLKIYALIIDTVDELEKILDENDCWHKDKETILSQVRLFI
jgi:hypothetical protein